MKRSVVLLSSGLDSTVNLYEARLRSEVVAAVTFDYGQRAAQKEIQNARAQCDHLGVRHIVVPLPFFREFTQTSLVNRATDVPTKNEVGIDDMKKSAESAVRVWVPNRNGIMLNIAAGYAEGMGAEWIVPGFNREEAMTFPDNSESFLESLNKTLAFSTNNKVEARCFTSGLQKAEIFGRAVKLGIDLEKLWPCYNDDDVLCGECESCLRFRRAYHLWKNTPAI